MHRSTRVEQNGAVKRKALLPHDSVPVSSKDTESERPIAPIDNPTVFAQLIEVAERAGRPDLVEEFRRRASEKPSPDPVWDPPEHESPDASETNPEPTPSATPQSAAVPFAQEGLRLLRAKKLPEAVEQFQRAIALDPDCHDAHGNLGVVRAMSGQRAEAEQSFREALRVRPDNAAMYGNMGAICLEQGKFAEAEEAFRKTIELAPEGAEAHRLLATVLEARRQDAGAEGAYRDALTRNPRDVEGHLRLGKLLARTGRPAEAEGCFRKTTELQPAAAAHWVQLGAALEAQNRSADAEAVYRVATGLDPRHAEAHNNLGVALAAQGKYPAAEASYRAALGCDPELAMAHNNLGNTLRVLERFDEAEASLREAIRLHPHYAEAINNLGIVLVQQRRIAEGVACYDEALRLRPDYAEAHLNRSLMRLAAGDFARGWPEYEWRFRMRNRARPAGPAPEWDGTPLNGRTLLLRAEQGLGDSAQFMRYGALVPRGTGGAVVFECPEPLLDLARTCKGIDRVVPRGQPLPPVDLVVPLLSVPGLLNTTLETVPAEVPYIHADPARVAHWRRELAPLPGVRVGISWQGSTEHKGDRTRSVPLARFGELAKVKGVTLCGLQKGAGTEQLVDGSAAGVPVHDFGSRTAPSFADTAALVQALDLVVSIDTAIVHVAGAFAVPVWVLLPAAADWRWLHDRGDSPWYPTMRLFRQPAPGDWDAVFAQVVTALHQWPDRLRRLRTAPHP